MKRRPEEYVKHRLRKLTRRIRNENVIRGLIRNLHLALFLWIALLYIDAVFSLDSRVLILLFPLFILLQFLGLYRWIIEPWREPGSALLMAGRIEETTPLFQNRLTAIVEADWFESHKRFGYSNALRAEATDRASAILERMKDSVITRKMGLPDRPVSPRYLGGIALLLMALSGGLLLDWPVPLRPSVERVLNPLSVYNVERTWDLEVYPGDAIVMRGDTLLIMVKTRGAVSRLEPYVNLLHEGRAEEPRRTAVSGDSSHLLQIGPITGKFSYFVSEKKRRSELFTVSVVELPSIEELTIRLNPPGYAGLAPVELESGERELYALRGTVVEVAGSANNPLIEGWLDFAHGEKVYLELVEAKSFTGVFEVVGEDSFRVVLVDTSEIRGEGKLAYSVNLRDDRVPEVTIVEPGKNVELNRDLVQDVRLQVDDDFGLLQLIMHYEVETRRGDKRTTSRFGIASFEGALRDTVVDYRWDLRGLGLFPGDHVRYRARILDNDRVSGPKAGWSRSYLLTLPTITEVFARRNSEIEETSKRVNEFREEMSRLRHALEQLERELMSSAEMDWEGRNAASEIAEKQDELISELNRVSSEFRKKSAELKREKLFSSRTLDRIKEVSRLFGEVATPEMMNALDKLRHALKGLDRELVENALEKLKYSEEEFMKGLDKTLRALKKLQMEQQLDALVEAATGILSGQEALDDELEREDSISEGERWKREEDHLAGDLDRLLSEMRKASELFAEQEEVDTSDELDSLADQTAAGDLRMEMDRMSGAIEGGEIGEAARRGEKVESEMRELKEGLEEIRNGLSGRWKRETELVIDGAIDDLLAVSSSEEKLLKTVGNIKNRSGPGFDSFLSEQAAVMEGLENVASDLFGSAEETYFIGRDVGRMIGSALSQMRQLSRKLESGEDAGASTGKHMKRAYANLNRALLALMEDRESMGESSSGVGYEEAFKRMMALAEAQAALNEKAEGIMPLPIPGDRGTSSSLMEELARMAAEQRRIQKELETVEQAMSGGPELLGRLDQLADEMERVASELSRGSLSDETVQRQRRILSRLLDAEKSLIKRDHSRRREAERPERFEADFPLPLTPDIVGADEAITGIDNLKGTGSYPEGYREAIRLYFRELVGQSSERREE